jgi:hypothetical protein
MPLKPALEMLLEPRLSLPPARITAFDFALQAPLNYFCKKPKLCQQILLL